MQLTERTALADLSEAQQGEFWRRFPEDPAGALAYADACYWYWRVERDVMTLPLTGYKFVPPCFICGATPVYAKGMCRQHYDLDRREQRNANQRAWYHRKRRAA